MAMVRTILLLLVALSLNCDRLLAASSSENRDFRSAVDSFNLRFWERAEGAFAVFAEQYPRSEYFSEAVLRQAQARFYQTNYDGAIKLLEGTVDRSERLADEYRYWIAEAYFQKGDYTNAAAAYSRLLNLHGTSKRRLASLVGEATARARLGQWEQVVASLNRTDGEFIYAVNNAITNEAVARGLLLLTEAHLKRNNLRGADITLGMMQNAQLDSLQAWQADRLRCEMQRASGLLPQALTTSSNMVSLANRVPANRAALMAESVALQASILDGLGRREEAAAVWRLNLTNSVPENRQREALLRSAQLNLALGRVDAATETLQKFLTDNPGAASADAAMFTLGELELKQSSTNAPITNAETNHVELALGWFTRLINTYSNSPLAGKAELNRGWCYWLRRDLTNSSEAFTRAVARLTEPEDLAVARYKLGDAFFEQGNFAWARENYRAAMEQATRAPQLRDKFTSAGWAQILSSDLKLNNQRGAEEAMAQILQLPLGGGDAERAMILRGQSYLDLGRPADALDQFEKFVALFPQATNRARAELLIAQTREQRSDWSGAVTNYNHWIEAHPADPLRAQAEFQRALAVFHAGDETNALKQMAEFVTVFATNDLAPRARWWMADYYFRSNELPDAEKNYKELFQRWPNSELADEAVMMAGRIAVSGSRWSDAIDHFKLLTSKLESPLWAQAVFALGDVHMLQGMSETNKQPNYNEAVRVLAAIPDSKRFQTNEIAALAWGEMAKCYRQMDNWSKAVDAYRKVIDFPAAGVATRNEAQVGLGTLQELMAGVASGTNRSTLLNSAASNYLDVVLEKNLRSDEVRDAYWVKRAGREAVRLLDSLQDWERLLKLAEKMQELLPVLHAEWQKKIDVAKQHLEEGKN